MIDKPSKTGIMTASQESNPMIDFKTLKETVDRQRRAKVAADAALVQELATDKTIVIGSGPTAVPDLMDWLNC